ncbi:hypothetical protein EON65_36430 [archaeon]|nr:MAG: hypothetical protein EON65_36430 [archaeon]
MKSILILLCVLICVINSLDLGGGKRTVSRDIVMLVSTKHYHYEVIAFLAVHFKRMGLDTQVHTAFGARFEQESTLDLLREVSSSVHNLDTTSVKGLPPKIKVVVIISSDDQSDINQLCSRGLYNVLYSKAEKVFMVMHNAKIASRMLKVILCLI